MTAWMPERLGMGWEFHHPDGVRLTIGQQHSSGHYIYANHELRWENGTSTRLISAGMINLTSPSTPKSIASQASTIIADKSFNWSWIEELILAFKWVTDKHREGRPAVDLAAIDDAEFGWLLRPYVEHGGHTRLIAAGGSRKSFLALAMELTVCTGSPDVLGVAPTVTGPCLYLDWETNDHGRTHAYRLRAIARGAGVEIPRGMLHHQQHDRPLVERVEGVAQFVDREGVVFVVVDSNTWARGSGGRNGLEAATLDLLEALRHINRPTLIIDHKSKEALEKGRKGGYGSIHNENQVRLQWEYTSIFTQDQAGDVVRIRLENTKANNVNPQPDQAYEIVFDNDRSNPDRPRLKAATFRPIGVDLVRGVHPGTEGGDQLSDRLYSILTDAGKPMTVAELAEALDRSDATVRALLSRQKDWFVNISTDKTGRWTTVENDPRRGLPDPFPGG